MRRTQLRGGGPRPPRSGWHHPSRRDRDRQAEVARRLVQRDAVLGQGARTLRRRRRPAGPGRRVAGFAGHACHGGARARAGHRLRHHRRGQPPGCLVHRRDRPRPGGPPRPCLLGARAARAGAEWMAGRDGGDGVGGIRRPLPPPHRDGARPRLGRTLAALDRRAAAPGRDAADQQRGRRVELRHARDGPADAPLRPFVASGARAERPTGPARRDGGDARRSGAHRRRPGAEPRGHR